MPGWINRAPDAPRPLLPNGVAAFLSAAAGPYIPVGCEPEQINGGWTPRAILPGAGIAALLPPPASYVTPASIAQPSRALVSPPQLSALSDCVPFLSASSPSSPIPFTPIPQAAFLRSGTPAVQLMPPGAAVLDDTIYVVCGDATQPIAAYMRAPPAPPQQSATAVAPLALPPAPYFPPAKLARVAPVIYPIQVITYEIAPFLTGAVGVPTPIVPISAAAYLRSQAGPQQFEPELAPLIAPVAPFVFATSIPMPPREARTPQLVLTPYTAAATLFVYTAPTPLLGLYARLAFAWPRVPEHAVALIPPPPVAPPCDVRIRFSSGGPEKRRFRAR